MVREIILRKVMYSNLKILQIFPSQTPIFCIANVSTIDYGDDGELVARLLCQKPHELTGVKACPQTRSI